MALYIDDLENKKIRIRKENRNGSVITDYKTDATFKMEVTETSVTIIDRVTGASFADAITDTFINGEPVSAETLLDDLSFIGSFNDGGSASIDNAEAVREIVEEMMSDVVADEFDKTTIATVTEEI
ncbi:MAG: hypothetical protein LBS54_03790 [Dysgonamonadaceae bacterium]|jgi:hypothetical protein|nr:hypothetical protein [Dysgonamonadaceae bacterium]